MKFLLISLLASANNSSSAAATGFSGFLSRYGIWIIIIALFAFMFVFSSRQRKKQEKEIEEKMNALKPGDQVETIGRIYGTIVSVDSDANTVVIVTGDDEHPSYIKLDKMAIYRTIVEQPPMPETAEVSTETPAETAPEEPFAEENAAEPASEAPADESTEATDKE